MKKPGLAPGFGAGLRARLVGTIAANARVVDASLLAIGAGIERVRLDAEVVVLAEVPEGTVVLAAIASLRVVLAAVTGVAGERSCRARDDRQGQRGQAAEKSSRGYQSLSDWNSFSEARQMSLQTISWLRQMSANPLC